jgi:hypothetical protein
VYHRLIRDHNDKEEYEIMYEDKSKGIAVVELKERSQAWDICMYIHILCFFFRETDVGIFSDSVPSCGALPTQI